MRKRYWVERAQAAENEIRRLTVLCNMTDTCALRMGHRGPHQPLAVRPNPPMPSDEALTAIYRLNGGESGQVSALRAVWRNGCDEGMVAQ